MKADTSGIEVTDEVAVTFYDNGKIGIESKGNKPKSETFNQFRLKITGAFDSNGKYQPSQAQVQIIPNPKRGSTDRDLVKGTSNGRPDADSLTAMTDDDKDKENSGKDYTTDYEGGIRVQLNQGYDYCRHGQTYTWGSSNGEVNSRTGYYCYQSAHFDTKPWVHQGSGWEEKDWSGNTYYSKSYSQWERYDYNVFQLSSTTLEPDGQMQWWGRCYTQGYNSHQLDGISIDFKLFDKYWQNCEDWATS